MSKKSDLNAEHILRLETFTPEELRLQEIVARRVTSTMDDQQEMLQMLGYVDYESGKPPQNRKYRHGTRYSYVHRKCRCEPCTTANNSYFDQRRAA